MLVHDRQSFAMATYGFPRSDVIKPRQLHWIRSSTMTKVDNSVNRMHAKSELFTHVHINGFAGPRGLQLGSAWLSLFKRL